VTVGETFEAPMFEATDTVALLGTVVESHGEADAFVEADGTRITFAQWQRAAGGVARGLGELGVGRGDVVCVMLPSSIDYAVAYQAIMRCGAITSGINLRLGPIEVGHILDQADPRLIIADDGVDLSARLPSAGVRVVRRAELADMARFQPASPGPISPDDPVAIVWTSGSTGRPKGAVFDHNHLRSVAAATGPLSAPFDRRLSPLPFAHVGTMTRVWDEVSQVITTVITPTPWRADVALDLMERERVTVGQGVPTQWELMLRQPDFDHRDLRSLRLVSTGASKVPAALIAQLRDRLGVPVLNRYATTEAAIISGTLPGDPDDVVTQTVGRPNPGIELRVVDDHGNPVAPGTPGAVQVRSAAAMRCYWNDPARTAAVLDEEGWLRVGDIGMLDKAGNLRFLGREGEMYLRGAYNIYPAEVEQVLREHRAVEDVAIVGVPDDVLGEIGHAFVVSSRTVDLDELRDWVGQRLADYKRPDRLTILAELPLTAMSKVDRSELERMAQAASTPSTPPVPQGADTHD
jgi:acyl-CoA synthetase (AMP-forming)/AMP-acid ligase II